MVAVTNNLEGGTAGSAVTVGNSGGGSGTAFGSVSAGAGQTITYTSALAIKGSLSVLFDAASTPTCLVDLDHSTPASSFAARAYISVPLFPGVSQSGFLAHFRNSTSGLIGGLDVDATNHIRSSIGATPGSYSTNALTASTLYRMEITGTGFNTAGSAVTTNFYVGDTMTLAATCSVSGVTTSALVNRFRVGRASTGTVAVQIVADDIAIDTGTSTELGPTASGPAPAMVFSKALIIGTT
jgi:hypothetical protein